MKKILVITSLLFTLVGYSQFGYNVEEELNYDSEGKYDYIGYNDNILSTSAKNNALKYLKKYAQKNDLDFKILDEKLVQELDPNGILATSKRWKYAAVVEFRNKDGNLHLTKIESNSLRKETVEKLKELKELLDMGIIDKSEFDSAAEPLKKILMKN
ncbi:MAG: hypothetical protein ACPGHV_01120 [Flavobacteriaceae bacterium]